MLTQHRLKELFEYDPESGRLTNKTKRSNSMQIGAEAGFENGNGYRRVRLNGQQVYSHHVIWAMENGEWPSAEIDHIDGDPRNNRISNLRECDRFGNTQNTSKRAHSQQPYKGVHLNKNGRWVAKVVSNKVIYRLGAFDTAEQAHAAYCKAAATLHGQFARVG